MELVLVPIVLLVLAVALGAAWWWSSRMRVRRAMAQVRPTRIDAVLDGALVKIAGRVVPSGGVVVSPLSGRSAVLWELEVGYQNHDGGNLVPIEARLGRDFTVADDGGAALVKIADARLALVKDHIHESWPDETPPHIKAVLESQGSRISGRSGTVWAKEGIIEPGERVAVVGVARRRRAQAGGLDLLELEPHPRLGLLVSDEPELVR